LIAGLLALMPALLAQQAEPGLFVSAPQPDGPVANARAVLRSRRVTIDAARLEPFATAGPVAADAPALRFNLFPDRELAVTIERVEATAAGRVIRGRLGDDADSSVALAIVDGVIAGKVAAGGEVYVIVHETDGIHVIQQVDQSQFPPELPPLTPPAGVVDPGPSIQADDGSIIDLLVAYTPSARTAQGGVSSIQALIDLGVSETNQAYANSGVIQRLRLVHKAEVAYTEAADMGTDLSVLRSTNDGNMDVVHSLRDTYGADLVQLLVNNSQYCGIAYLMTTEGNAFASSAFGVTHYSCVSPNYSFGHEMGHNMGLHHDLYATQGATGSYPYSRGYVNQAAFAGGAPTNKRWRDIMAYNDQCAASKFNCSRLLYFSNPSNTYTSDPMGNASTANGVRSLNDTRTVVANFRQSIATTTNLSINDASVTEGNSGTKNLTFTISLSAAATSTTTVNYATQDVTATSADYVAASGVVTIGAGSSSQTLAIVINGDTTVELTETFRVNLSSAVNAVITDSQGVGTIVNDDTTTFTDPALTAGTTPIRTIHLTELRASINAVRSARGLGAYAWTDTSPAGVLVKAVHIEEMRTALAQAYAAAGVTAPTYTDSTLTGVVIKTVHISQLRAAVNALE
jgi:hypothetical protein